MNKNQNRFGQGSYKRRRIKKTGVRSASEKKFPILVSCCFCIPLQKGLYIIALIGAIPSCVCLIMASPVGMKLLEDNGISKNVVPVICGIHGVLGVIVLLCHFLLFIACKLSVRKFYLVYLVLILVYILGSLILAIIIANEAIKRQHTLFGIVYLIFGILQSIILLYFWVVVHSQLYTAEKESNVVTINITII